MQLFTCALLSVAASATHVYGPAVMQKFDPVFSVDFTAFYKITGRGADMRLGYGTTVGVKMQGDNENDIANGLPIFWMCYGAKESDFKICSEYAFYRAVKKQRKPKVMKGSGSQQGTGSTETAETVQEKEEENVKDKEDGEGADAETEVIEQEEEPEPVPPAPTKEKITLKKYRVQNDYADINQKIFNRFDKPSDYFEALIAHFVEPPMAKTMEVRQAEGVDGEQMVEAKLDNTKRLIYTKKSWVGAKDSQALIVTPVPSQKGML